MPPTQNVACGLFPDLMPVALSCTFEPSRSILTFDSQNRNFQGHYLKLRTSESGFVRFRPVSSGLRERKAFLHSALQPQSGPCPVDFQPPSASKTCPKLACSRLFPAVPASLRGEDIQMAKIAHLQSNSIQAGHTKSRQVKASLACHSGSTTDHGQVTTDPREHPVAPVFLFLISHPFGLFLSAITTVF